MSHAQEMHLVVALICSGVIGGFGGWSLATLTRPLDFHAPAGWAGLGGMLGLIVGLLVFMIGYTPS